VRILHINTDGWIEHEGIARVVAAIVHRLPEHEHHLVAQSPSGTGFAELHTISTHPSRVAFTRHMRNVLDAARPDLVHLHGGGWAPLLASARSLRNITKVVSVYSQFSYAGRSGTPLQVYRDAQGSSIPALRTATIALTCRPIARHALRSGRVAALVSPDHRVIEGARGAGETIYARGAAEVSALRAQFCEDEPTIVFAGRGETGRGIDDLIEAHAILREIIPGAKLRLLLLPGSATSRWAAAKLPGVEVSDHPIPDIAREFAHCQVAVVPFRLPMTITPPLVAAEAMSVGLPVIATNLPSLAALVNSTNGATVDPRRPDQIAQQLIYILTNRDRWERLSTGAIRTIETDWNWSRSAEGAAAAYSAAFPAQAHQKSNDEQIISLPLETGSARATTLVVDPVRHFTLESTNEQTLVSS
jgi:alpha-maltose-1-phosphate synthase